MQIESVVIVGGGSSGWMTAAALSKLCPWLQIALVESKVIPKVGVGESTLGHFNKFLKLLGLKDEDWMPYCNATYKNSIQFTNFRTKDSGTFQYPFQTGFHMPSQTLKLNALDEIKLLDPDFDVSFAEFFAPSNTLLVKHNKETKGNEEFLPRYNFEWDTAYHLDAEKFGEYLRDNIAIPNGVVHIYGDVAGLVKDAGDDPSGSKKTDVVVGVFTEQGQTIEADLIIDCTGFKSLLLEKQFGSSFVQWDNLRTNRAWAARIPYPDDAEQKDREMINVTDCEGMNNGWCWTIPLWNRIGTGYAYSNGFCTDAEAKEEFYQHLVKKYGEDRVNPDKFFRVSIKHGKRRRAWVKNCVGIGLSYGFVEPLESTGLLTTHENIIRLVEILNRRQGYITRTEIESYNFSVDDEINNFYQFVSMHYAFSQRNDTPYWRWATTKHEYDPDMFNTLRRTDEVWFSLAGNLDRNTYNESLGGMNYILSGMGVRPISTLDHARMRRAFDKIETDEDILNIRDGYLNYRNKMEEYIKTLPSHYEYLRDNIYGGVDKCLEEKSPG